MSSVCILTPVVVAAWPAFSAAVFAAATSLGFTILDQTSSAIYGSTQAKGSTEVELEIAQSELVTDSLARQEQLCVTREDVTVTFSRDARGRAAICVSGTGRSKDELRAIGEELSGRVVQQYVYRRLMEEMSARQFLVVDQETDENHAIRLKVRHWEN